MSAAQLGVLQKILESGDFCLVLTRGKLPQFHAVWHQCPLVLRPLSEQLEMLKGHRAEMVVVPFHLWPVVRVSCWSLMMSFLRTDPGLGRIGGPSKEIGP